MVAPLRPPRWHLLDPDDRLDWLSTMLHGGRLNDFEHQFVGDLLARPLRKLTRQQAEILDRLFTRAWAEDQRR